MLAPYWSDIDIRTSGRINYVVYLPSSMDPQVQTSINNVAQTISNVTTESFSPDWTLLINWEGVYPFPSGSGGSVSLPYTSQYIQSVSLL